MPLRTGFFFVLVEILLTKGQIVNHLQNATQECFFTDSFFLSPSPSLLRGFNHGPGAQMEDQEFHVLIPIILGLILLALLGLLVKRVIQKRKGEPLGAWLGRTECHREPRAFRPRSFR